MIGPTPRSCSRCAYSWQPSGGHGEPPRPIRRREGETGRAPPLVVSTTGSPPSSARRRWARGRRQRPTRSVCWWASRNVDDQRAHTRRTPRPARSRRRRGPSCGPGAGRRRAARAASTGHDERQPDGEVATAPLADLRRSSTASPARRQRTSRASRRGTASARSANVSRPSATMPASDQRERRRAGQAPALPPEREASHGGDGGHHRKTPYAVAFGRRTPGEQHGDRGHDRDRRARARHRRR